MVSNNLIGHVDDESVDPLHRVLQSARTLHRKPRAHGNKKYRQQQHHQQFHRKAVRDRRRRMLGVNMKRLQQRQHRRAEQTIQKCGKSQLFHFSDLFVYLELSSAKRGIYSSLTIEKLQIPRSARDDKYLTPTKWCLTTPAGRPCTLPMPPPPSGLRRVRTSPTENREKPWENF